MLVFSRFLTYFAEVARLGSIRKASESLNVSASAIDRQILRAEEEFSAPLFERLPSGLRLTAAGELLLNSARHWRKDYARVRAQMADLRGMRRGEVRIAIIEALAKGFVPDKIKTIREEFPGVSFRLHVMDNADVMGALVEGEMDFGIMLSPQSSKDLMVVSFVDIDLGVVTLPNHALARRSQIRLSQLVDLPMILASEPLALAEQLRALISATGTPLNVVAAADHIQMIKSLVQQNVGVAILSWLDVMNEVASGELTFVKLSDAILKPLTLSLCVVPNRQLSAAATLFLNRLQASFPDIRRGA